MDVVTTGVALPALHRAFVDTARRDGSTAALHACACFAEQLLSDTVAAAARAATARPDALPAEAGPARLAAAVAPLRELCTALARAMAADPAAPADEADQRMAAVAEALAEATAATDALWRSAAARTDEETAALLRHAADWKTPECYGYDLADPELSLDQAAGLLAARPATAPVLVVGVRTGGSYLAPFWQAAAEDAGRAAGPWHSVRPLRGAGGITLPDAELATLPRTPPPGTTVVLVDDQPDTGATARAVRDRLGVHLAGVRDIVLAAPGRLYTFDGPVVRVAVERPVVRMSTARLWQLADARDTAGLVAHARAAGVPLAADAVHRLRPFRGPFLAVYGTDDTADTDTTAGGGSAAVTPAEQGGDARRIDPRKRPFTLTADTADAAGTAAPEAYHFRFIGTGMHGLHCHRTLRALGDLLPPGHTFADGYLITRHEPILSPLRDALPKLDPEQRRQVLGTVAASWEALRRLGELGRPGHATTYEPRARLEAALRRLRHRMGRPLPVDEAWTTRHVPERVPLGGVDGVLFRTPLPYGHGYWHWQLAPAGNGAASPAVRRFGLDWIWGGGGCLESEIASFAVENRLDDTALAELREAVAAATGDARAFDGGLRLAGEALHWNVKTWLRRCPVLTGATADRVEAELAAQARYVAALA
uniref:Putative ribostamycin production protein n=1 Tax=Streptomyces ribosidificus TaxID=80859 RepID=Q4R0X1_STRRI|nr:putative ribostamycin production protein [Streptomyces ribosidificus]CAG34710.1 RacK protein [Streptomyces ribosidificus]